jgi:HPt (histidine-containing phosphotransfer) domain-containing protein
MSQVTVTDPILLPHLVADWRAAGGSEFVVKVVTQFINDAIDCVDSIQIALDSQRISDIQEAAHGLKGMSANMGLAPLATLAHQLETLGREQNLQESSSLFEAIQKEFVRVQAGLQKQLEQEQPLSR